MKGIGWVRSCIRKVVYTCERVRGEIGESFGDTVDAFCQPVEKGPQTPFREKRCWKARDWVEDTCNEYEGT